MKIENCQIRVSKHTAATEVFITNASGVNTVLYLPAGTDVDPAQPLEFVPAPPPPPPKTQSESTTTIKQPPQ